MRGADALDEDNRLVSENRVMSDGESSGSKVYDTRRTSAEKLSRVREIANEMLAAGSREPNNETMQKIMIYAEKIHRSLDGGF